MPEYTWTLVSGELPPGLKLPESPGRIAGTPTTAGTFTFTVRVTDSRGALAERTFSIVEFHALRTRQAGRRAFVSLHLLVPGARTVQQGHELAERVERDLRQRLPYATVFTHVEPREDAASFDDVRLHRSA